MDRFNSKMKVYPDGQKNTIFASKDIFSEPVVKIPVRKSLIQRLKPKSRVFSSFSLSSGFLVCRRFSVRRIRHVPVPRDKSATSEASRDRVLKRAHDSLFDLVYCNPDLIWFLSITFNPDLVDSFDVPSVMVKVRVWLSNLVSRRGLKYILVPEYHKSGRIHCHLLCNGVFDFCDSGKKAHGTDGSLHTIYNVSDWKFGFSTAIHTYGDLVHVACYITKYLTKQNEMIFGRYYWSSRNLKRKPDEILFDSDFQSLPYDSVSVPGTLLRLKYLNEMRWTSYEFIERGGE